MSREKHGLETGALNQFSNALADLLGQGRFIFHKLSNPPEPDGLCSLDGQPLHVEVAHLYGTPSDPKRIFGRTGRSAVTPNEQLQSSLKPIDVKLLLSLNKLLADKAIKTYQSPRVWLLIRSTSPLWNCDDFKKHRAAIGIPRAHPFEQIWLLCGPRATFGIIQLA